MQKYLKAYMVQCVWQSEEALTQVESRQESIRVF